MIQISRGSLGQFSLYDGFCGSRRGSKSIFFVLSHWYSLGFGKTTPPPKCNLSDLDWEMDYGSFVHLFSVLSVGGVSSKMEGIPNFKLTWKNFRSQNVEFYFLLYIFPKLGPPSTILLGLTGRWVPHCIFTRIQFCQMMWIPKSKIGSTHIFQNPFI